MTSAAAVDEFDLVIVGAGVLGITAALMEGLRDERGRILLIDRGVPLGGASGLSAALIVAHTPTPRHRALMGEAWAWYTSGPLRQYVTPVPMFVVTDRARAEAVARDFVEPVRAAGDDRTAALLEHYPDLQLGSDERVLDCSDISRSVDVQAMTRDALALDGVLTWPGSSVVSVNRSDGVWEVESAAGPTARSPRVLIATGAWPSPVVRPEPGGEEVVSPHRVRNKLVAALHVAPNGVPAERRKTDGGAPERAPGVVFLDDDLFILPGNPSLVSFRSDVWPTRDTAAPETTIPATELAEGRRLLATRSPRLADRVIGGRAFPDGYTEERLPAADGDPRTPGLAWMEGGSGSGVRFAPAIAQRALDIVDTPLRTPAGR